MIEHRQLRHVLALANHGNFRRAAEALNLTQPALTKSIHGLEESLGVKLFDRHPRSIVPTAFGKVVIERARAVISEFEGIKREIDMMGGLDIGELAVGAEAVFAENPVGPAVGHLVDSHPGLRLRICIDDNDHLIEALHARNIDFFIADISISDSYEEFEIIPLYRQRIVYFCRPGHPLLKRTEISLNDLHDYRLAAPKNVGHAPYRYGKKGIMTAEISRNKHGGFAIECESYPMLKKIVQSSNCLSIAPIAVIVDELQAGALAELSVEESEFYSQPGVVYLRKHTLSPAAEALIVELAVSAKRQ